MKKRLAIAVAASSAIILAVAYISQYGFGLKPCILCLYQRVPYMVAIGLGIAAALWTRMRTPLLWLCALTFLVGAGIAGFHVGVEYKWWPGLPSCGGQILPTNASIEELRQAILHQEIVRCDKPAWTLFGISMAGYNFLTSLMLAFLVGVKTWRAK